MPGVLLSDLKIAVPVSYWPHWSGPVIVNNNQEIDFSKNLVNELGIYDLMALEEALNWRDRWGCEVTVLSVGPLWQEEGLREALSLGADAAVRLWDNQLEGLLPEGSAVTARLLAAWISNHNCQLVLCGDKSNGGASGRVGSQLANFLDRPVLQGVVQFELFSENKLKVTCKGEKGSRKVFETQLPVVLAVGRIGEPRYFTLTSRLSAQKVDIPVLGLSELGINPEELATLGSSGKKISLTVAKPKPKKIFTPDSNLSAADRMKMILSGGLKRKKNNVDSDSQSGTTQIYDLLKKEGLI